LAQANKVMNDLIKANDGSYRAHLLLAEYRRKFDVADGDVSAPEAAARDVAKARKLAPDEPEVLLAAAAVAQEQNRPDEARSLLRRGCEVHPKDWRLHLAAARLEVALKQPAAALERLDAGLRELPHQADLLWERADELTAAGRKADADEAIDRLDKEHFPADYVDCLRARRKVQDEEWLDAITVLEKAYSSLIGRTNQPGGEMAEALAQRAGVMLGQCYEQIGDADRAFDAYSRVVARNDASVPGRLGMANARRAQGRLQEALDQYRLLMRLPGAPPGALAEIARLTLLHALEVEEANRNWPEVDRALTDAERLRPLPPAVAVLRAEYLALSPQKDFAAARAALVGPFGDPKTRPPEVWVGLSALEVWQDRMDAALAVLDDAQRQCGDGVELRLARARYWVHWVRRGPDQARKDRARESLLPLAGGTDKFPAADRRRLLEGLGNFFLQAGLTAEGGRLWEQLAREQPGDLRSRVVLFDLAAAAGDADGMTKWQEQLREIEGPDGLLWKFARASALVRRAQQGDRAAAAEARTLLAAVNVRRPNWARVPLCQARLDDLDVKTRDAAASEYLRAIDLGERDPAAIGRVVVLLCARQRYDEANAVLRKLSDETLLPPDAQRAAAEVALRIQDKDHGLALAERPAVRDSKDYRDHLLRAGIYWSAGDLGQAEAALVHARDLAPTAPEPWVNLVRFLVSTGHADRARAAVVEAGKHLTAPTALPGLAQCHLAVGQKDRAAELYRAAVKGAGDNAAVLRAAAGFFLQAQRHQEAMDVLVRLSKHPDKAASGWALRVRSLLLAATHDPAKEREALALLDSTGGQPAAADSAEAVESQRVRAKVLALQKEPAKWRDAARILDGLIERKRALPEDYLLAAQLYEKLKEWPRARSLYARLVELTGAGPAALADAARGFARHEDVAAARKALDRLDATAPRELATKEIRARVLHLEGKTAAAVTLLEECGRGPDGDLQAAAGVLKDLGEFAEAEKLYQAFAETKRPGAALPLIYFLIERNRPGEALDLCDRSWDTARAVDMAQAALYAVDRMPADRGRLGRLDARLAAATAEHPDDVNLLAAQAMVYSFQGRVDDAVATYRRLLRKQPRHASGLNNLAWLLALQGGHGEEALDLVNRAAEVAGYNPVLEDTRAVARLTLGRKDAAVTAVSELEQLITTAPSPTLFFHLAEAYEQAGRRADAARMWQQAKGRGLTRDGLHPLERPAYERLDRDLK
ncbi:MAG TPA: tetratricopeptide repeat protein, partial [Gemmataceae bacterium]